MLRQEIAQQSNQVASQEGPGEETNWWQDLARTLQLRINQLEDEVRRLKNIATSADQSVGAADMPSDDILEQLRQLGYIR